MAADPIVGRTRCEGGIVRVEGIRQPAKRRLTSATVEQDLEVVWCEGEGAVVALERVVVAREPVAGDSPVGPGGDLVLRRVGIDVGGAVGLVTEGDSGALEDAQGV